MNCETALRQLGPAMGPRPQGPASGEAWGHLDECIACQRVYTGQAALVSRLQPLGRGTAPPSVRERVSKALAPTASHRYRTPRRRRWAWATALGAAAVLIATAATRGERATMLADPVADAARANSRSEIALASRDASRIERWIERRIGYHVTVPLITDASLEGARVTTVADRPSAAIVYRSRGAPVTYFALPADDALSRRIQTDGVVSERSGEYQVALWMEDGQVRAIAAPMARAEVVAMANECRSKAVTD